MDEERVMYLKSGNTEFTTVDNANDVVDELFESFLSKYQFGLETSMTDRAILLSIQLNCCITNVTK